MKNNRKIIFIFLSSFLFFSCSEEYKEPREDVVLQSLQTKIEDLAYKLHCIKEDVKLLEEKVTKVDEIKEFGKNNLLKDGDFDLIQKRLSNCENKQEKICDDLRNISFNNLTKLDQRLLTLEDKIVEIGKIKTTLEGIAFTLKENPPKVEVEPKRSSFREGSNLASSKCKNYIVKSGDSLEKIAKFYKISFETLKEVNHLDNKDLIFVGQKLIIPEK